MEALLSLDEIVFDEEPHTYLYRGRRYDSVTQVLRLAGIGEDFKHVNEQRLEYARRRGQMVHIACHYYSEGELDMATVHESIRGHVEAYVRFRQDRHMAVIANEKKLVCPATLELAGTPDLVCFIAGRRSVVDYKTGQSMPKSVGPQTAGYKILWNHLFPNTPIHDRYALKLMADGKYRLTLLEDPDDEPAFMDALHDARSENRMMPWRLKYGRG